MVYEPQEDSYLLAKQVEKHAKGRCLDIGTGTGIQIMHAKNCKRRLAVDIDPKAVKHAKKIAEKSKARIEFRLSDLFSNVPEKFDTIIFNPPYLPDHPTIKDIALDGGKKGYELTGKFLGLVNEHLDPEGRILLLFSSLTKKEKVDEIIDSLLMDKELLVKEKLDFEELYVYKIVKSAVRKELESKGLSKIRFLARGKRGRVYSGIYDKKEVAIKIEREDIDAKERIKNEAEWLKILNEKKIGPKYYFSGKNYVVMELVDGIRIDEFLKRADSKKAKKVFLDVFEQCFIMDELCVNKEEMHKPYKHVLVGKRITLIDFERCRKTDKPKNVTQFVQFVNSTKYRKEELIELAKEYKKNCDKKIFKKILKVVKS